MICRLQSLVLFLLISACSSLMAMAAPSSSDKPAKEETPAPASSTDKAAKAEPAAETDSKDKPAKADAARPLLKIRIKINLPKKRRSLPPATPPAKEAPAAAPAPQPAPTHTVKREPIKIQFELDGTFESRNMTEIILRPEEWPSFIVLEAVEHGARVKKDEVLIKFDSEKIDKAIADMRTEQQIAEITLKVAEDQLAILEKTTPLDLEASQRAQRNTEEDSKRYFESTRPMVIKSWDYSLKFTRQQLEYAREELEQLEKMYKADDLTEETEKIVLKRARNTVERAEFSLEREEYDYNLMMKIQLP